MNIENKINFSPRIVCSGGLLLGPETKNASRFVLVAKCGVSVETGYEHYGSLLIMCSLFVNNVNYRKLRFV